MYTVLIRVDETLPWIELKGEYTTRREARRAAQEAIGKITVTIVNVPQEKRLVRALATVKAGR